MPSSAFLFNELTDGNQFMPYEPTINPIYN